MRSARGSCRRSVRAGTSYFSALLTDTMPSTLDGWISGLPMVINAVIAARLPAASSTSFGSRRLTENSSA